MLCRIHGKEEAVCLCEEEADGFKDKNYQQEARVRQKVNCRCSDTLQFIVQSIQAFTHLQGLHNY